MVTLTPQSPFKRVKMPARRTSNLSFFLLESLVFTSAVTLSAVTRSPQYILSELKDYALDKIELLNRAPNVHIKLPNGEQIGICAQSARKDL